MQILEGDKAQVTETYNRIARDTSHSASTIMNVRDIEDRLFPNWTMGGAMRTPEMEECTWSTGTAAGWIRLGSRAPRSLHSPSTYSPSSRPGAKVNASPAEIE